MLGDVRSKPYSRMNPQFNRAELECALRPRGIDYRFLGRELGARSEDPSCYEHGKVRYDFLAQSGPFRQGIELVREHMKEDRITLMCAEKEPLECHRTILIARHLAVDGTDVQHIHADGRLESHKAALDRLLQLLRLPEYDLFRSHEEVLEEAYRRQEDRIAYEVSASAPEDNSGFRGANP